MGEGRSPQGIYQCSQWWMLTSIIPDIGYLNLDSSRLMRLLLSASFALRHQLYSQWALVLWSHISHQRNTQMLLLNHQGEVLVLSKGQMQLTSYLCVARGRGVVYSNQRSQHTHTHTTLWFSAAVTSTKPLSWPRYI